MNRAKKNTFLIILFILITTAGILFPGLLLHHTFTASLNQTSTVSMDYTSSNRLALSKNASAKLSEAEKIKLISGAWDSTETPVASDMSQITEQEAAQLARNAIQELYKYELYPYHFDSSYGNWYSWDAQLYQCTENTFHTYTAYYWLLTFYKYNNNEVHEVLITEEGTLLSVRCNRYLYLKDSALTQNVISYFQEQYKSATTSFLRIDKPNSLPVYGSLNVNNPVYQYAYGMTVSPKKIQTWEEFYQIPATDQTGTAMRYCIYLCHNSQQSSMMTIIPWE